MTDLRRLHRRLLLAMGIASLVAFLSGAGLETPFQIMALGALLIGLVWQPSVKLHERLEWFWRLLAILLALRALLFVFTSPEDVVLPMVDVLLALMVSEALRPAETSERTRMYTISFALMVGAAAYRAGVAFGIAFIVYSTVATVALMVGHLLRESQRFEARPPQLTRPFLFRVAALSSVMLFMSGLLFIAFPRVTRSWVTRGTQPSQAIVGFSDRVSLEEHGSRIYPNPEVVLRVEFPRETPPSNRTLYWRGRSYDFFDGTGWWHSPRARSLAVPLNQYRENWPRERLRPKVYAVAMDLPILFALHPTLNIRPYSRMRSSIAPTGDVWFDGLGPPIYEVIAPERQPTDAQLSSAPALDVPPGAAYLQLPELSPAVRALADSLTVPHASQIGKARAVESYLRSFRYTLDLPRTAREATLEHFLFRRRAGHCEYFSSAMVVLLRSVGIPARNVNGFLGGEWNQFGNYMTVTQNQAHSWVEVWFPVYGWVSFDPTPAATTDVAAATRQWWGPLRFLVDGMEHRWNKWVLEYNLDTQLDLFRRAADAIGSPAAGPRGDLPRTSLRRLLPWAALLFILALIVQTFRYARGSGAAVESPEARTYIKLRRLYRKAGYAEESLPPLGFVERLRLKRSPGADHAARLVDLYVRSRFGGEEIGEAGRAVMRNALSAARTAVSGKQ